VAGLQAAATLADTLGDARAETYRDAAARIAAAIPVELLDAGGVLAGSKDELDAGDDYLDLAAVEAYNLGVLDARDETFDASLDAWDRDLAVASGNGYHRNDDGSDYDAHEWIVIDLRLAEALRRSCRPDDAAALEDWVTGQAIANNQILPELYDPDNADYAGPAPMLGFGSGAYVLAMNERDAADGECDAPPDDVPPDVRCGCGGGDDTPADAAAALLLLPLLSLRRRRT
jgi:GH15 family glucan-1,4-alpha-glucosidase